MNEAVCGGIVETAEAALQATSLSVMITASCTNSSAAAQLHVNQNFHDGLLASTAMALVSHEEPIPRPHSPRTAATATAPTISCTTRTMLTILVVDDMRDERNDLSVAEKDSSMPMSDDCATYCAGSCTAPPPFVASTASATAIASIEIIAAAARSPDKNHESSPCSNLHHVLTPSAMLKEKSCKADDGALATNAKENADDKTYVIEGSRSFENCGKSGGSGTSCTSTRQESLACHQLDEEQAVIPFTLTVSAADICPEMDQLNSFGRNREVGLTADNAETRPKFRENVQRIVKVKVSSCEEQLHRGNQRSKNLSPEFSVSENMADADISETSQQLATSSSGGSGADDIELDHGYIQVRADDTQGKHQSSETVGIMGPVVEKVLMSTTGAVQHIGGRIMGLDLNVVPPPVSIVQPLPSGIMEALGPAGMEAEWPQGSAASRFISKLSVKRSRLASACCDEMENGGINAGRGLAASNSKRRGVTPEESFRMEAQPMQRSMMSSDDEGPGRGRVMVHTKADCASSNSSMKKMQDEDVGGRACCSGAKYRNESGNANQRSSSIDDYHEVCGGTELGEGGLSSLAVDACSSSDERDVEAIDEKVQVRRRQGKDGCRRERKSEELVAALAEEELEGGKAREAVEGEDLIENQCRRTASRSSGSGHGEHKRAAGRARTGNTKGHEMINEQSSLNKVGGVDVRSLISSDKDEILGVDGEKNKEGARWELRMGSHMMDRDESSKVKEWGGGVCLGDADSTRVEGGKSTENARSPAFFGNKEKGAGIGMLPRRKRGRPSKKDRAARMFMNGPTGMQPQLSSAVQMSQHNTNCTNSANHPHPNPSLVSSMAFMNSYAAMMIAQQAGVTATASAELACNPSFPHLRHLSPQQQQLIMLGSTFANTTNDSPHQSQDTRPHSLMFPPFSNSADHMRSSNFLFSIPTPIQPTSDHARPCYKSGVPGINGALQLQQPYYMSNVNSRHQYQYVSTSSHHEDATSAPPPAMPLVNQPPHVAAGHFLQHGAQHQVQQQQKVMAMMIASATAARDHCPPSVANLGATASSSSNSLMDYSELLSSCARGTSMMNDSGSLSAPGQFLNSSAAAAVTHVAPSPFAQAFMSQRLALFSRCMGLPQHSLLPSFPGKPSVPQVGLPGAAAHSSACNVMMASQVGGPSSLGSLGRGGGAPGGLTGVDSGSRGISMNARGEELGAAGILGNPLLGRGRSGACCKSLGTSWASLYASNDSQRRRVWEQQQAEALATAFLHGPSSSSPSSFMASRHPTLHHLQLHHPVHNHHPPLPPTFLHNSSSAARFKDSALSTNDGVQLAGLSGKMMAEEARHQDLPDRNSKLLGSHVEVVSADVGCTMEGERDGTRNTGQSSFSVRPSLLPAEKMNMASVLAYMDRRASAEAFPTSYQKQDFLQNNHPHNHHRHHHNIHYQQENCTNREAFFIPPSDACSSREDEEEESGKGEGEDKEAAEWEETMECDAEDGSCGEGKRGGGCAVASEEREHPGEVGVTDDAGVAPLRGRRKGESRDEAQEGNALHHMSIGDGCACDGSTGGGTKLKVEGNARSEKEGVITRGAVGKAEVGVSGLSPWGMVSGTRGCGSAPWLDNLLPIPSKGKNVQDQRLTQMWPHERPGVRPEEETEGQPRMMERSQARPSGEGKPGDGSNPVPQHMYPPIRPTTDDLHKVFQSLKGWKPPPQSERGDHGMRTSVGGPTSPRDNESGGVNLDSLPATLVSPPNPFPLTLIDRPREEVHEHPPCPSFIWCRRETTAPHSGSLPCTERAYGQIGGQREQGENIGRMFEGRGRKEDSGAGRDIIRESGHTCRNESRHAHSRGVAGGISQEVARKMGALLSGSGRGEREDKRREAEGRGEKERCMAFPSSTAIPAMDWMLQQISTGRGEVIGRKGKMQEQADESTPSQAEPASSPGNLDPEEGRCRNEGEGQPRVMERVVADSMKVPKEHEEKRGHTAGSGTRWREKRELEKNRDDRGREGVGVERGFGQNCAALGKEMLVRVHKNWGEGREESGRVGMESEGRNKKRIWMSCEDKGRKERDEMAALQGIGMKSKHSRRRRHGDGDDDGRGEDDAIDPPPPSPAAHVFTAMTADIHQPLAWPRIEGGGPHLHGQFPGTEEGVKDGGRRVEGGGGGGPEQQRLPTPPSITAPFVRSPVAGGGEAMEVAKSKWAAIDEGQQGQTLRNLGSARWSEGCGGGKAAGHLQSSSAAAVRGMKGGGFMRRGGVGRKESEVMQEDRGGRGRGQEMQNPWAIGADPNDVPHGKCGSMPLFDREQRGRRVGAAEEGSCDKEGIGLTGATGGPRADGREGVAGRHNSHSLDLSLHL